MKVQKNLLYLKCALWDQFDISIWFLFWAIVSKAQNICWCMNTFQIHLLTNGSMNTTFWIGTNECASLQGLLKDWHTCINVIRSLSILTSNHKISFWIRITPQNWLILGCQKFQMARMKMWYVPYHLFFIGYVHAHYILVRL